MIISFTDKETEKLYCDGTNASFGTIQRIALRKLDILNAAINVDTLRIPPGNHLESPLGDRKGQYSIRINDQYRICFRFKNQNAYDVEIVDYH